MLLASFAGPAALGSETFFEAGLVSAFFESGFSTGDFDESGLPCADFLEVGFVSGSSGVFAAGLEAFFDVGFTSADLVSVSLLLELGGCVVEAFALGVFALGDLVLGDFALDDFSAAALSPESFPLTALLSAGLLSSVFGAALAGLVAFSLTLLALVDFSLGLPLAFAVADALVEVGLGGAGGEGFGGEDNALSFALRDSADLIAASEALAAFFSADSIAGGFAVTDLEPLLVAEVLSESEDVSPDLLGLLVDESVAGCSYNALASLLTDSRTSQTVLSLGFAWKATPAW